MADHLARTIALGLLLTAASACISSSGRGVSASVPVPAAVLMDSRTVDRGVPVRPGQLTAAQVDSLAPRIRVLRADPNVLDAFIGDTVRVAREVRILALDSAGTVLGELPTYDFGYAGRGFRVIADGGLTLSRAGTIVFTARLPATLWTGAPAQRPSAVVTLSIRRGGP